MINARPFEISGKVDGRHWTAAFRPGDITGLSAMGVAPSWTVTIDGIDGACYGPSDVPGEDTPATHGCLEVFVREQITQHATPTVPAAPE